MQLQFLGATETVTGSKYLLEHGSERVLVDCGLFQGYKQLRLRNWAPLPFDAAALRSVVLTHAHLDHSGALPLLDKAGLHGPVHCTPATADLCAILLPDSGHLLEEEANYNNRHGTSKHHPALPLYTRDDAQRSLRLLRPVQPGTEWEAAPGLLARFVPAGHMPGAASVRLDDGKRSVLFSGDIGRAQDPLLKPPETPPGADYVIVESTYGDRLHPENDALEVIADVINRTAARGGVVVIPSFAVGRSQVLLYCIHQLKLHKRIHNLPVYLNSPMAANATQVFLDHHELLRIPRADCEAMVRGVQLVQSAEESQILNARKGPMVIIAASGMATGGRVVHHLKAFAPDKRNSILLAGHQAAGTRGAALAGGARSVRIFGEDVPVRAEVVQMDQLSAHADAAEIVEWLRKLPRAPKKVFITHGEPAAADALRLRMEHELKWPCHLPYYTERVALD